MSALVPGTTQIETITRLRNALSDGAWHVRMCIDEMENDARWHDAQKPRTRLLEISRMLEASAHPCENPVVIQPLSKSVAKKRQDIVKPSSTPHAYKRKYDSLNESEVTSKTRACNHTVKHIQSKTGWYVDHVELEYEDGSFESHGKRSDGYQTRTDALHDGETIIEVVQEGWSYGHLGSALIFRLSTGREIRINGCSGQRKIKEHKEFSVSSASPITSLLFEHGILVKVCARL